MGRAARRALTTVLAASVLAGCTIGTPGSSRAGRRQDDPKDAAHGYLVGSCTPPPSAPPASGYRLTGCIATGDGRPVPHPVVAAGRKASFSDLLGMTIGVAFTLGACLAGPCVPDVGPGKAVSGKADGTFAIDIPADARTGNWEAVVLLPGLGSMVKVPFKVKRGTPSITLPPLVAWQPRFRIDRDGRRLVPRFDRLPGDERGKGPYDLVLGWDTGTDVLIDDVASGDGFDERLFPSSNGFQVVAYADVGTLIPAEYRSAPVEWQGAPAPASRSAGCRYADETGKVHRFVRSECWATDGETYFGLVDVDVERCDVFADETAPPCGEGDTWTEVDLRRPVPVRTVVVHGVRSTSRVEVSDDRVRWREVARHEKTTPKNPFVLAIAPGVVARYVRLVSEDAGDEVTEIGVYSD